MKLRKIAVALSLGAIIGGAALPALAAEDPTTVTVTGGNLSLDGLAVGNFAGVTLDGTAKTTTATPGFSVTDARGTGAGWNVTVRATQFAEHDGTAYVVGGKTLPANSLSLAQMTATANGTSSPAPTVSAANDVDGASAVKIATAAVDTGMGTYDFTGTGAFTLAVPASAYAKTYRSDVTFTVATGP